MSPIFPFYQFLIVNIPVSTWSNRPPKSGQPAVVCGCFVCSEPKLGEVLHAAGRVSEATSVYQLMMILSTLFGVFLLEEHKLVASMYILLEKSHTNKPHTSL